jgi:hypothetical protein
MPKIITQTSKVASWYPHEDNFSLKNKWNDAINSPGGNTDLAIDLFDDMMSTLGPNLKQELLTRSVQSNTRVNTLFSEVNINSLID